MITIRRKIKYTLKNTIKEPVDAELFRFHSASYLWLSLEIPVDRVIEMIVITQTFPLKADT